MNTTNLTKICFKTDYSRRFPDPLNKSEILSFNMEHHILLVRAIDLPKEISLTPNPREQNIDKRVYKKIQSSLADPKDAKFHLRNKGITMFAHRIEISDDKKNVIAFLGAEDGIADGGHTYKIITDAQEKKECPENQYVKIEIITGVPDDDKVDIVGGLNTCVQVQAASLANLDSKFEWVKDEIKDMPYSDKIAYRENEEGDFDIRDLVAFMTIFNVEHPNLRGKHPKEAYTGKDKCLRLYQDDKEQVTYKMLKPILKDILYLYDYINLNIWKKYDEDEKQNGMKTKNPASMKGIFNIKEKGKHQFIFANEESEYKLFDGTFFPIFGAMRYLVEKKGDVYSWKLETFEDVKKVFDNVAGSLLKATYSKSEEFGHKPNSVGKNETHWDHLYDKVKNSYLEFRMARSK